MSQNARLDTWQAGDSYDAFMGRWSRRIAPQFLDWLAIPAGREWIEIGCGTGALSAAILSKADPKSLIAIDPSQGFIDKARANVTDARVDFRVGDAQEISAPNASRDVAVAALALNFVPDRPKALAEMKRVLRPNGMLGFYVWDYPGGGQEFIRAFWRAATALDSSAQEFNETKRFPYCTPDGLRDLTQSADFSVVEIAALETPTVFKDFADYWHPFILGAGPAPGYCTKLAPDARERLREKLERELPREADGSISMRARAWGVKARA
ncbi:MAG: class SAM-dependent methyltransferase [Alphaproteobacteria bacterium]|jgi:ubiquinone/menaquinone biosynthesis C-methylase UbiE|nr:class SAM-dependent methyltransferase [Alphaproteobacteria bacterium]